MWTNLFIHNNFEFSRKYHNGIHRRHAFILQVIMPCGTCQLFHGTTTTTNIYNKYVVV